MDSLPGFPHKAVHPGTEDVLTAGFEMRPGEPIPYDRPIVRNGGWFIKVSVQPLKPKYLNTIPLKLYMRGYI